MSASPTWTLPSTASSSLAAPFPSHRWTSSTRAAFRSSLIRKWQRLRCSSGWSLATSSRSSCASEARVGWHELLAADWETAWAFYSELFGWQKAETDKGAMGTYQQFSAGGQTIGGMFTKPSDRCRPPSGFTTSTSATSMRRPSAWKLVAARSSTARLKCRAATGSMQCTGPSGRHFRAVGPQRHRIFRARHIAPRRLSCSLRRTEPPCRACRRAAHLIAIAEEVIE